MSDLFRVEFCDGTVVEVEATWATVVKQAQWDRAVAVPDGDPAKLMLRKIEQLDVIVTKGKKRARP